MSKTEKSSPTLNRRRVFAAGGTAGALAAVAAVAPLTRRPEVDAAKSAQTAQGDGYQLSAHVQRYYDTARV